MVEQELHNITHSKGLWSSSEDNLYIQDMSHWRSVGRWNDDEWLKIGNDNYSIFEKLCKLAGRNPVELKTMLEWGPGGGANLYRFSDSFKRIAGVDISSASLRECASQLDSKGPLEYELFLIDKDPDIAKTFIKEKLDFFLSVAVFQHFPSQQYGLRVLDCAADMLKENGLALIQTRYCGNSEKFACKTDDYGKNFRTFTSYEIDEFWNFCETAGFNVLGLILDTEVNYAFYLLQKC